MNPTINPESTPPSRLGVGILVGGQGQRMGGVAKGLLPTTDGTPLVQRLITQVRQAAPLAAVFLLGDRPEYDALPFTRLADNPANIGPLGGLHALLEQDCDEVLLLGGDLPFVTASLIHRVLQTPCNAAVAARVGSPPRWDPMLSRYLCTPALAAVKTQLQRQQHGLYSLLNALRADALDLTPSEVAQLVDWDTPHDVAKRR